MQPRESAARSERAVLPAGDDERFQGYGVLGAPFASGHALAMRRFPANSIGGAYTSVWHRDAAGAWTFYADVDPMHSCPRYFGAGVQRTVQCPIELEWPGPRSMRIAVPSVDFTWEIDLDQTLATRALNAMARAMPDAMWKDARVLSLMARIAGPVLRAGRLQMQGLSSNRQRFIANPMEVWSIARSQASMGGVGLGAPAPLAEQTRLGDFWIPQRGLFAFGRAFFEPFDEMRHLAVAAGERPAG